MSQEKPHVLHHYMKQLTDEMASDYEQIHRNASQDPGTAGDRGEQNWANLLREWLPDTYKVVTKGKIINHDGHTSPQVDVVVLKSSYPKKLIDEGKKMYLAAGVAAAFECKTTLKTKHIEQAIETCVKIKNLYRERQETPYQELHAPIVYGLLAHSHSWKCPNSTPEQNIKGELWRSDNTHVVHPRFGLDLLCVADLGTWVLSKFIMNIPQNSPLLPKFKPGIHVHTTYIGHTNYRNRDSKEFKPIGTLISGLSRRLAWEDTSMRDLARYYDRTSIEGSGSGSMRVWPDIVIKNKRRPDSQLEVGFTSHDYWDEWNGQYL